MGNITSELCYGVPWKALLGGEILSHDKVKSIEFFYAFNKPVTTCEVKLSSGDLLGISKCHPKDTPSLDTGRKEALKNTLATIDSKETRRIVWDYYHRKFKEEDES